MSCIDFLDNLVQHSQEYDLEPWPKCTFDDDFILVAEFSELEGPRTVLTIPQSGGGSFNKNAFAVRIMSVDCTSWQIPSAYQNDADIGFTISGDTQVVMNEPGEGAVAYVHHFTLYDIHARGFVRPFCIAYVTSVQSRIMSNFNNLLCSFSKVANSFRFGNAMSFLRDLKLRSDFLENLKRMKSKTVSFSHACSQFIEKHAEEIENINVEECLVDTHRLQTAFLSFLKSPAFQEQQERYGEYFKSFLVEHSYILLYGNDVSGVNSSHVLSKEHLSHLRNVETVEVELATEKEFGTEPFTHLSPHSVGITGGRKFDIYLRTIEELSDPVGKDALFLTENIYFVLKNSTGELNLEEQRLLDGSDEFDDDKVLEFKNSHCKKNVGKKEPRPDKNNLTVTPERCYKRSLSFPRARTLDYTDFGRNHSASFQQWDPMFTLFDNDKWSLKSSDSYEIIKHTNSSDDEVISISPSNTQNSPKTPFPGKLEKVVNVETDDREPYPLLSLVSVPRYKTEDSINPNKRLFDETDGEPITVRSAPQERTISARSSFENITITSRPVYGSYGLTQRSDIDITKTERQENTARFIIRQISTETTSSTESNLPKRRFAFRKFSNVLGPDSGYFFPDTSSFSLYKIRQVYSFLPHLIFSLLIGRPVIIHAEKQNESKVRCLVKALLPFIPGLHERHSGVIFWTRGPVDISLLKSVKLIGVLKGSKRILSSVKHYTSILDFEAGYLYAPPYDGLFLNSIFDQRKEWPSEDTFFEYLRVIQKELTAYCFVNFSLLFFEDDKFSSCDKHTEASYSQASWNRGVHRTNEFFDGKLLPSDKLIVQHLTDVVKEQIVRNVMEVDANWPGTCIYSEQFEHTGKQPAPPRIRLNNYRCQCFKAYGNKKKER